MQRGEIRFEVFFFFLTGKTQKRILDFSFVLLFSKEPERIFAVQFYSWRSIRTVKQYTTSCTVNTMRPTPAGRFAARYSTARASDALVGLACSRGEEMAAALQSLKKKKWNS